LKLRGIALHDERLGEKGGRCRDWADVEQIVNYITELNCNYVRLAHYPHHESMMDLCDEKGLLVWDEIPVYWDIDYKNEKTIAIAAESMRSMVLRNRKHPCVLCHSVANETFDKEGIAGVLMKKTTDIARELDRHVPVAAAMAMAFKDNKYDCGGLIDVLLPLLDIVGYNEYGGWYSPAKEQLGGVSFVMMDKPVMVSEFGAAAPAGRYGDEDQLWNEDSQLAIYKAQFELFDRTANLIGLSPWVLKDFRSTLRQNKFQRGFNRKGLISNDGVRKKVFDFIKAKYMINMKF